MRKIKGGERNARQKRLKETEQYKGKRGKKRKIGGGEKHMEIVHLTFAGS